MNIAEMKAETGSTLYDLFAEIPLGYNWLLRSNDDGRGRYFANLYPENDVAVWISGEWRYPSGRRSYFHFDSSPEAALQGALDLYRVDQTKH